MKNNITKHRLADFSILVCLFSLVCWYAYDAYSASTHIANLILIIPVTAIVMVLCGIEFIRMLSVNEVTEQDPVSTVLPVILLFIGYVLTLNWLGFDVGTFLFLAIFLWIHGERRIAWVIGYSLVFATLISLFFSGMLPYPMPMLVLSTAY